MKFFEHEKKKTLSACLQDKTSLKIHWKRFYDQTAVTRMRENHLRRRKSLKNYVKVDILWQVVSKITPSLRFRPQQPLTDCLSILGL